MGYQGSSVGDRVGRERNWSWVVPPKTNEKHTIYIQPLLGEFQRAVMAPRLKSDPEAGGPNAEGWARYNHWVQEAHVSVDCVGDIVSKPIGGGRHREIVQPGLCGNIRLKNGKSLHDYQPKRKLIIRCWAWYMDPPDNQDLAKTLHASPEINKLLQEMPHLKPGRPALFEAPYQVWSAFDDMVEDTDQLSPEWHIWSIARDPDPNDGFQPGLVTKYLRDSLTPAISVGGAKYPMPKACIDIFRHVLAEDGPYCYHKAIVKEPDVTRTVAKLQESGWLIDSETGKPITSDDPSPQIDKDIGVFLPGGSGKVAPPTVTPSDLGGAVDLEALSKLADPFGGPAPAAPDDPFANA